MKQLMPFIIFIGVFLGIKVIQFVAGLKGILSLRLKEGSCQIHDPNEIDDYILDVLVVQDTMLGELDFSFSHCQLFEEMVISEMLKKHEFVYYNPQNNCYANVSVSMMPDKFSPAKIEFTSYFSDGTQLLTVNCLKHNIIDDVPNTILRDNYLETILEHFQYHLDELEKLKADKTEIALDSSQYIESQKKSMLDYFNSLKQKGILINSKDGNFKYSLKSSIGIVFQSFKALKKANSVKAKKIKSAKKNNTVLPEVPIEAEVKAFKNMKDLTSNKKGSFLGKAAAFVISALLFIFAFGVAFSAKTAVIIFVAIFIHELGHYLGMVMFNYKDLRILFIPLLGAATIGRQEKTTPLREITIYLLGPAPGILIGVFCIIISDLTGIKWLHEYAIFSLILNYLNLLPIFPLDGGRIFELLIFSRAAFLKTAFKITSTLVIGFAGLGIGDPILIGLSVFLGIGVLTSMGSNRALSKVKKSIATQNIDHSDERVLYHIFKQLKEKPFTNTPFLKKFQIAKSMLDGTETTPPGAGITTASLGLYFATIILPITMLITYRVVIEISASV